MREVVVSCLDVGAVWSIGHPPGDEWTERPQLRLLAFASAAVLEHLRRCDRLHDPHVEFLVVTDGDAFATAWGPAMWSGSLSRWAWRQTSDSEAYYDESQWAEPQGRGAVVRMRRRAFLVWARAGERPAPAPKWVYNQ